jgi:hypothetical protein
MPSIKEKLNNLKKYGNFEKPKYKATIVFKDMYGKLRKETTYFYKKPGKTMKLDHRTTAKIINVKLNK